MFTRRTWILAAALVAPLALAVGCDDDDTGPTATALVEAVLDGSGGVVTVSDGGVAVTGATVSLNGTAAAPGAADGEYDVTLAAPVAAGGAMTLDVSDGEIVIQGTGTVPEAPVITAPLDGADVIVGADVEVTWTSTADPDGWLVTAVSGGSTVTAESADGALRAITIAGASLAAGDWVIGVHAVNDGLVTGDTEAGSTMEVHAAASPPTITIATPLLLITGSDMGPQVNNVVLSLAGVIVNGAMVMVNGEAAIQPAADQDYSVTLAAPVAVGGELDLDVTNGADVYQGLGNVPEPPVVTAPADAAVFGAADPIQVDWTSTADPDRFVVKVVDAGVPLPFPRTFQVGGTLRSFTIPGGTFTPGAYTISVFSYEDGVFTGPAHPDSRMSIRGELGPFPEITVNP